MEDIKALIGKRIKKLRLDKKLSQEKLANIAGLDRTYVTQVENGKRNISIENIEKICIALEITIAYFFSDCMFEEGDE